MLAIIVGLIDLTSTVIIAYVLGFHMYLWKKGITTYEYLKKIRYLEDERGKPLEKTSLSASFSEKSLDVNTGGKSRNIMIRKHIKNKYHKGKVSNEEIIFEEPVPNSENR